MHYSSGMQLLNRLAEPILYHIYSNKFRCCSCKSVHRMLLCLCTSQRQYSCSRNRTARSLFHPMCSQRCIDSIFLKHRYTAMKYQQSLMAQLLCILHLVCLLHSGIGEEARMCLYPHSICSRDPAGRRILSQILCPRFCSKSF